jgi:hypothetical protein
MRVVRDTQSPTKEIVYHPRGDEWELAPTAADAHATKLVQLTGAIQ